MLCRTNLKNNDFFLILKCIRTLSHVIIWPLLSKMSFENFIVSQSYSQRVCGFLIWGRRQQNLFLISRSWKHSGNENDSFFMKNVSFFHWFWKILLTKRCGENFNKFLCVVFETFKFKALFGQFPYMVIPFHRRKWLKL